MLFFSKNLKKLEEFFFDRRFWTALNPSFGYLATSLSSIEDHKEQCCLQLSTTSLRMTTDNITLFTDIKAFFRKLSHFCHPSPNTHTQKTGICIKIFKKLSIKFEII